MIARLSHRMSASLRASWPYLLSKFASAASCATARAKSSLLPVGTAIPAPLISAASPVFACAIATIGRPEANMPASFDGNTRSATSGRCGNKWMSAVAKSSGICHSAADRENGRCISLLFALSSTGRIGRSTQDQDDFRGISSEPMNRNSARCSNPC